MRGDACHEDGGRDRAGAEEAHRSAAELPGERAAREHEPREDGAVGAQERGREEGESRGDSSRPLRIAEQSLPADEECESSRHRLQTARRPHGEGRQGREEEASRDRAQERDGERAARDPEHEREERRRASR